MNAEAAVAIVSTLIAVISVLISLLTAVSAAKKDAFEQLQKLVTTLQTRIEELEAENGDLRDWAEKLVDQLHKAKIRPAQYFPKRKLELNEPK